MCCCCLPRPSRRGNDCAARIQTRIAPPSFEAESAPGGDQASIHDRHVQLLAINDYIGANVVLAAFVAERLGLVVHYSLLG